MHMCAHIYIYIYIYVINTCIHIYCTRALSYEDKAEGFQSVHVMDFVLP